MKFSKWHWNGFACTMQWCWSKRQPDDRTGRTFCVQKSTWHATGEKNSPPNLIQFSWKDYFFFSLFSVACQQLGICILHIMEHIVWRFSIYSGSGNVVWCQFMSNTTTHHPMKSVRIVRNNFVILWSFYHWMNSNRFDNVDTLCGRYFDRCIKIKNDLLFQRLIRVHVSFKCFMA